MKYLIAALILTGCATESIRNTSPNGALTEINKTSFFSRSHIKSQAQTGSTSPVPPTETAQLPDTSSNITGFEMGVPTIATRSLTPPYVVTRSAETNPNANFFYYESQSDPEPGVRALRIGTVGAIAAYGINAAY